MHGPRRARTNILIQHDLLKCKKIYMKSEIRNLAIYTQNVGRHTQIKNQALLVSGYTI